MMGKHSNCCSDCRYFYGYDGVGELWTGCSMYGDFKGTKTNCESFEKKVTKDDLLYKIQSLEKENRELRKEMERHCKVVTEHNEKI